MQRVELDRPVGVPLDDGVHDVPVFAIRRPRRARKARNVTVALGRVEHLVGRSDQPLRTAGRDQAAVKAGMREFPGGIAPFEIGVATGRLQQAMKGEHDALLPRRVAILDRLAQRNLVDP
jgi:hypothetical protein